MRRVRLRTQVAGSLRAALAMLLLCVSAAMAAQNFDYRSPSSTQDPTAAASIRDLASRLLPVYQDSDAERYLANLSALQMAVGDYTAADISRQSLRERRRKTDFGHPIGRAAIMTPPSLQAPG